MSQHKRSSLNGRLVLVGCLIGLGLRYYTDPAAPAAYNLLYATYVSAPPTTNVSPALFCPDPDKLEDQLSNSANALTEVNINNATWELSTYENAQGATNFAVERMGIQGGNMVCRYSYNSTAGGKLLTLRFKSEQPVKPLGGHWPTGSNTCQSLTPSLCPFSQ